MLYAPKFCYDQFQPQILFLNLIFMLRIQVNQNQFEVVFKRDFLRVIFQEFLIDNSAC